MDILTFLTFSTQSSLIKYIRTIANDLFATQFEITVLSPVSLGHYNMMRTEENSQSSQRQQNVRSNSQNDNNSQNIKQNSQRQKQNVQNERKTRSTSQNRSKMNSNKDCNSKCDQKFKKLHQKRTNDEQKRKSKNNKSYENKKRKLTENNNKCETRTKKNKSVQLDQESVCSNVPQKYKTRSQKSHTVDTLQISDLNLSQSKKRKQNDENHTSSKKDNNFSKKRRITNTNSQNDHMDECNNISQEDNNENIENVENETVNIDECFKLFNINISNGPVYVCTVCLQTWFRRSVSNMQFIKVSSQAEEEKLNQCRRYYVSAENKEWICRTCRDSIKNGKIPKLSIENKMGFPEQPTELNLNGMEERLTSPRLTLFQMRDLPCGAQKSVRGNSVNLPIDIAPTVDMLPHTLDNSETIAINFKRRMCYKGCAFKKENI